LRPENLKCGEICLLATTLKNAKIIRCFCVFVTAPHSCGAFVLQIAGQAGNDVIPDLIGNRYNQKDKKHQRI